MQKIETILNNIKKISLSPTSSRIICAAAMVTVGLILGHGSSALAVLPQEILQPAVKTAAPSNATEVEALTEKRLNIEEKNAIDNTITAERGNEEKAAAKIEEDIELSYPSVAERLSEKIRDIDFEALKEELALQKPELSVDEYYLMKLFPDGADETDPKNSYGARLFQALSEKEAGWYGKWSTMCGNSPAEMAELLGLPRETVMGGYNVTDPDHDPNDPSTWDIGGWKHVNVSMKNGDDVEISDYSAAKAILAMASVYSFYHDPYDVEAFEEYVDALWEAAHDENVTISDIYFDEGQCTEEWQIIKAVQKRQSWALATPSNAVYVEPEEPETQQETESSDSMQPDSEDVPDELTTKDEIGPGIGPGAGPGAASAEGPVVIYPPQENNMDDAVETEEDWTDDAPTPADEQSPSGDFELDEETIKALETTSRACAGHVDLNIDLTIIGTEEANNLFALDPIGNDEENFTEEWTGWTEDRIEEVRRLMEIDWVEEYGVSKGKEPKGTPLTEDEIQIQLGLLPDNISRIRMKLAETALRSAGHIPYYFGGKPETNDYAGNNFYRLVGPDHENRVFRGLDCSGWVNWVYWSVTGKRLEGENTYEQVHLGVGVEREELQTGDIIVRPGTGSRIGHVVMFLRFDENGDIVYIHECGAGNVQIGVSKNVEGKCRKLVY